MDAVSTQRLSLVDKLNLAKIESELKQVYIRKTYRTTKGNAHSTRTKTTDQKRGRQETFGLVKHKGVVQESAKTKRYPNLWILLNEFMQTHKPHFEFTSVFININTVCGVHIDSGNKGGSSVIVGAGAYTGGETVVHARGESKSFDIASQSIEFDACTLPHASKEFQGQRISLVYFSV